MDNVVCFGKSQRGFGHIASNKPNQDYYLIKKYRKGIVMAVSDGVGSRPLSNIGSRSACEAVDASFRRFLDSDKLGNEDLSSIFRERLLYLIHANWLFGLRNEDPRDCCATLLFTVVIENRIFAGRLGDGCIYIRTDDTDFSIREEKKDSFTNITSSLNAGFDSDKWEFQEIPYNKLQIVSLATDGISEDVRKEFYPEFVKNLIQNFYSSNPHSRHRMLGTFLGKNWPVPRHTDDKTIVCLCSKSIITPDL